jgi:hypothetical protein
MSSLNVTGPEPLLAALIWRKSTSREEVVTPSPRNDWALTITVPVTGTLRVEPLVVTETLAENGIIVLGGNSACAKAVPAIFNPSTNEPAALLDARLPFPSLADLETIWVAVINPPSALMLFTVELLSAWALD